MYTKKDLKNVGIVLLSCDFAEQQMIRGAYGWVYDPSEYNNKAESMTDNEMLYFLNNQNEDIEIELTY
jgi:hypothetical protein